MIKEVCISLHNQLCSHISTMQGLLMNQNKIGIIGGSGLYKMQELQNIKEVELKTPYGKTSSPLIMGEIDSIPLVFLARHGVKHSLLPSEVPYKANIFAMKELGVKYLLSVSAVGSLREEIKPEDIVIVDQYIDHTKNRLSTFFGNNILAHVSMAKPTCKAINQILIHSAEKILAKNKVHNKGTYIAIEGPQFSSYAESHYFRQIGADVVGMTNMPEAKLAMEAQIAYSSMAMVTDYDCWRTDIEEVNAQMAIAHLMANAQNSQSIIKDAIKEIAKKMPSSLSHKSLENALLTDIQKLAEDSEQRHILDTLLK